MTAEVQQIRQPEERWVDCKAVAAYLGISPRAVSDFAHANAEAMGARNVGTRHKKVWRFRISDIKQWMLKRSA